MESQVVSILVQLPVAGLVVIVVWFAFREFKEQRREFTEALASQRAEFIEALREQKSVDTEAIQVVRNLQVTQAQLMERWKSVN